MLTPIMPSGEDTQMSTNEQENLNDQCNTLVNKIDALLDEALGFDDIDMMFPKIIGTLMAKRKRYDRFTTESNSFKWMADAYVAAIVGPLGPKLLELHQYLVKMKATPDNCHDFEHCDRYGAYFSDGDWKSMAFMTQNYTYMVVLEPAKTFCQDDAGQLQMKDDWVIHIRLCTPNAQSYDFSRPSFSSLSFLADTDKVHPEIGYGDKAHAYFRYKDGRDQGYLCSVRPDLDGGGYRTENSLWGPAFSYLGGVLYDLGCHHSCIPKEELSAPTSSGA